jgi:hypothetical protein
MAGGCGGARGDVNVSVEGGAGRPPERAGRTGGSDGVLEAGESEGLSMPSPALRFALAMLVDDVRSGWLRVGVVGDGALSFREIGAEGLRVEALSESPRAGLSSGRLEPNDDSEVCGESCEPSGGELVKVGSMRGRLSRADMMSFLEEDGCCCCCCCGCGDGVSSESLRLASAFLFLGTSCSLKGSGPEGAGEAC